MLIQPVVLSGGSGTRLWPLSREKYPKQLLALVGGEDTLLQATVRRVDGLANVQLCSPMVVCNEEYRFVIAEQLRLMGKEGAVVLEPFGRNTAPALTLAALAAVREDGARLRAELQAMHAQRGNLRLVTPVDGLVASRDADPMLFFRGRYGGFAGLD